MKKKISVIDGDGIGPEIMESTIKILKSIEKKYQHHFSYHRVLGGGMAIEKFGVPMPEETMNICSKSDAILLSCFGDPKYDHFPIGMRPEDGLLKLRKSMKAYCNIRPIFFYNTLSNQSPIKKELLNGVNFVIYRELTGGIYFGKKGRIKNGDIAYDHCTYSKKEIERIGYHAFHAAMNRTKKLTLVDKSNVLETSRLWREVICKMGKDYPEVTLNFLYVDNAAMQIILTPSKFDIILTDNMFGDILSDLSSVLIGSLGLLPSSSIGYGTPIFEPVHGSYPQAKGKNIANPIGCILSASMMLEYFGMYKEQKLLIEAVNHSIKHGIITKDLCSCPLSRTTSEVGNYIVTYINNH
ncbi:3-isopropylmalate dehydrogenase [Blattabacterium cuenoti]|uniref:3-isopropylmalate dehydrogenase n=1 Tax=Blattabacterium cuenoti TaxID=1653831 RepID=UPI00163B8E1D|nr:3-isopropylmalate dehydrogenase [Blattabacterium cuenoti]